MKVRMNQGELKDFVYGRIASIAKAASSPKRLELLDLLCQGEKPVEMLAERAEISIKLVSAHLKELKAARLVECRKDGKYVIYRLANDAVAGLWVKLREIAESRFLELPATLAEYSAEAGGAAELDHKALIEKAKKGEVVVLDVRPQDEYRSGHLPYAVNMPLQDLPRRAADLPKSKEIIAYCKGSHCLQASEAVKILRKKGYKATRIRAGITDWRAESSALFESTNSAGPNAKNRNKK